MKILELLNAPFALREDRLAQLHEFYQAYRAGEKQDLQAWAAVTGQASGSSPAPYAVQDGVAILDLMGVLTKSASIWNRICGLSSTSQVLQDLKTALADPQVHSIILRVDSPGGTVDGTQELADAVFAARDQKPIVSLADGQMCSAAFWIGAAASEVFITTMTSEVGSIGVYTAHTDISQAEAAQGRKTTIIKAGKFKATGHPYAPLSEQDQSVIQGGVDYLCTIFITEIAKFRGVSVDTVLADMAEGRVFIGQQAIDAGLVDGVSTLADLVAQLNQEHQAGRPGAGVALIPQKPKHMEDPMSITREQLAADAPDLLESLKAEGRAEENARVKGCFGASILGYEDLARSLALDGKTSPGEAALAINAAHNADLQAARKKAEEGGPAPLPSTGDPAAAEAEGQRKKVEDEAARKKAAASDPKSAWETDANLRAEFGNDYAAYEAFAKAEQSGQARILGRKAE
jgi:signal peptide peptidase SppA